MMNIKLFVSLRGSSLTHRLWAWCSSKNAVFLSSSMALHTSLMISLRWAPLIYSFMGISQRKCAQCIWIFKIVQICFLWISKTVQIYVFLWIPKMVNICFFLNFQNCTQMFFLNFQNRTNVHYTNCQKARTGEYRLQPGRVNGKPHYVRWSLDVDDH